MRRSTCARHAFYFSGEISLKLLAANHFYILVESEHEAAYAEERHHFAFENPGGVAVGCEALCRLRILLHHEVVGEQSHAHFHHVALLTSEHEHVGVHLLVAVVEGPGHVDYLHRLHARQSERLVLVRAYLVTAHVALVVHQLIRLHDAVGDGVAVGRGVLVQHYHLARSHRLAQLRHAVVHAALQFGVDGVGQIERPREFLAYVHSCMVARAVGVESAADVCSLVFGERDVLVQTAEERRRAVEPIRGAGLLQIEATVAQVVEIIVEIAARDAEAVSYLLRRVAVVLCQYEYKVEFSTILIHSHCC